MSLPVLEYLSRKYSNSKPQSKELSLFAIQHLLPDAIALFKSFQICEFKEITVIGIPYSTKNKIVTELGRLGLNVVTVPFTEMYQTVEKELYNMLGKCDSKNLIILEDGGYATPILHKPPCESMIGRCKGVVEQTKNGLWRDREIDNLRVPIVSPAESKLKDSVEAPAVGEAVANTLQDILGAIGISLEGRKIGVIGYGAIGMNVALSLKSRKAIVWCSDINVERKIAARTMGFITDTKSNMIRNVEIIIGATGRTSIDRDDILNLRHGAYICSASSKNIEINLKELDLLTVQRERRSNHIEKHILRNGKEINLIGGGFPINFIGKYSVPGDVMDLILSELFVCVMRVRDNDLPPGIYPLTPEEERKIADLWDKMHM